MWPRHIEVMLACWLAITPFVFAGDDAGIGTRVASWGSACAVLLFSLITYVPWARRSYLLTAATGTALFGWAYFSAASPPSAVHQNFVVTGLLLMMTGIIPSYNNRPPKKWAEYEPERP